MKKYLCNKYSISLLFIILIIGIYIIKYNLFDNNIINKPKTSVSYFKIKPQTIENTEEFPGRATSYKVAEIRPQVNGIILDRLFKEGSKVKKGQQLYTVDPALYQASYDSAKASLEKVEATLKTIQAQEKRYKDLIKIKAISDQEYDDIIANLAEKKADVKLAKANLNVAEINLEYTKVLAPIDGYIGKSLVTIGALVNANQSNALTTITQLDPIYIDATGASEDISNLQNIINFNKNYKVNLLLHNQNKPYEYPGELGAFDAIVDPSTNSLSLRIMFPNPSKLILPGMFVRTKIDVIYESSVLIPQQATIRGEDGDLSVWIINSENKVNQVKIKADKIIKNMWLVKEGLKENDKIVIEGIQKIAPGILVDPKEVEIYSIPHINIK